MTAPQTAVRPSPAMLDPEPPAALRDQLCGRTQGHWLGEEAATWAHRVLGAKSTLVAADAKQIEEAFHENWRNSKASGVGRRGKARSRKSLANDTSIDKSELSHPEPRRIRDREHVRFVIKQPCLICGRTPSDPHHLRFTQPRALGRKVSDEFIVPLCRGHHREVHRCGDEAAWWEKAGIIPVRLPVRSGSKPIRSRQDRSSKAKTTEA